MLAFIHNINPTELVLIAVVAILVFGRRLPEVAGRAAAHAQRARRAFNDLRRDSGIDDELREARRTFEQAEFRAEFDRNVPHIEPPTSQVARSPARLADEEPAREDSAGEADRALGDSTDRDPVEGDPSKEGPVGDGPIGGSPQKP